MVISVPECATPEQRRCIEALLEITGNPPSLEQLSACVDFAWDVFGCDNKHLDWDKIGQFYGHPVWLLNGLFIEQHDLSQANRRAFVEAVKALSPTRVADFGGGFGNLARMLAHACPEVQVDIIEPHPTSVALDLSDSIPNLSFKPEFVGEYDVIIATDVFEHVPDPLADVEYTSAYLKNGGVYLIANCFYPVIKCHLPCDFHFRYSFSWIVSQMGLKKVDSVLYGHMYRKKGRVRVTQRIRALELFSRKLFPLLKAVRVSPR